MPEGLIGAGAVALGAALGGPARFFLSGLIARRVGETFPWGTMIVNITGAFAIGLVALYAQQHGLSGQSSPWLFLVTGILGSYTTVSSFSLQTMSLVRDGEPLRAIANAVLSLLLCIGAAEGGYAFAAHLPGNLRF
jgi:CrcB protein